MKGMKKKNRAVNVFPKIQKLLIYFVLICISERVKDKQNSVEFHNVFRAFGNLPNGGFSAYRLCTLAF